MKLLSGQAEHTLDAKNRMRIPAKFRSAFPQEESIYAVGYKDLCLFIMPESSLQRRLERLVGATTENEPQLNYKRRVMTVVSELAEDTQGRMVIPPNLRKQVKMHKELVSIGMGDYIELWAKEVFEEEIQKISVAEAFTQVPF